MPYQCQNENCKKVFQHTAKLIEFTAPKDIQMDEDTTLKGATTSLESSVCPFCRSKAYSEIIEEKQGAINLADVASLIDCQPSDANKYLQEGYVLFQTWQKNVFLVKLKKTKDAEVAPTDAKPDNVLGDAIRAGIQDAKAKEATQ